MRTARHYDWNEFIDFSEQLFNNLDLIECSSETVYRIICSRTYYGIFKLIEDFCKEEEIPLPDRDESGNTFGLHKKIKIYLNGQNRALERLISRLYTARIKADYKKYARVNQRLAEQSINNAKQAKELFDQDKENWT